MLPLRRGVNGDAVADVRRVLAGLGLLANTDPVAERCYDAATELAVRHFQQRRGLSVDGIVGPETWGALWAARWQLGDRVLLHVPGALIVGDDVTALQKQLLEMGYDVVRPDGVFGRRTEEGLRGFQRDYGLVPDGVCGPQTLRSLRQLGRRVVGGRPQLLRDEAAVALAGPNLVGKRVVIDPGHGGEDPGVVYGDYTEADLVWDLATRLEGRLVSVGVSAWLTRGARTSGGTDEDRAVVANDLGADLLVSLHIDAVPNPLANGLASYHYGTGHAGSGEAASNVGERLAGLVQREIVARTGMTDGRVHGKTWALLRLTRMPAVRVELGYLSSPVDRARLIDPAFRDTVAEGLLVAIQRLYLPKVDDPVTGVMRIPAIAVS